MKSNNHVVNSVGSIALGTVLTAAIAMAFLLFVSLGSFAPAVLAAPVSDGATVTVSFVYGLGLIVTAVLLTCVYVIWADAAGGHAVGRGK